MDKIQELTQRISDLKVGIKFKEREILSCREQLSLARIEGPKGDGRVAELTEEIANLKKEISETLPAEIAKTEQKIVAAKEEAEKEFMKEFEKEAELATWKRKSQELLESAQKCDALNREVRGLYNNYLDLRKKKDDAKLDLKNITTGFPVEILRTIASEIEREIKGEARSSINWPMLQRWP